METVVIKSEKKRGRKKLSPRDIKKNFNLPLSEHERELIEVKAKMSHLPTSSFIRKSALDRELPKAIPELNENTANRLGKLSSNYNEVLKLVRQGKVSLREEQVEQMIYVLKDIRKRIIGEMS